MARARSSDRTDGHWGPQPGETISRPGNLEVRIFFRKIQTKERNEMHQKEKERKLTLLIRMKSLRLTKFIFMIYQIFAGNYQKKMHNYLQRNLFRIAQNITLVRYVRTVLPQFGPQTMFTHFNNPCSEQIACLMLVRKSTFFRTYLQNCCARYFTNCDELSIEAIFSDFCEFRYSAIDSISDKTESQKTYLKSEVMEFITGLGRFFDTMYPLQLLYKYDDPLPADSSRPISSCSILHLLRFLSRLQPNIQEILQNNDCANTLKPLFQMFLNWLE